MIRTAAISALLLICSTAVASEPTLIAPMIEGLRGCKSANEDASILSAKDEQRVCINRKESAASLVEATLAKIGPKVSADGRFELGYMLGMPLLSYVRFNNKQVLINRELIRHDLRIISDSGRSMVLYLFSNHFIGSDQAEIAKEIAQDPRSLMHLANGDVPTDNYFSSSIYPWTIGDEKSLIEEARKAAMQAVLEEVCRLSDADRKKIRAVTTLGEVHYLFPNFMSGMGYEDHYAITDYSENAKQQFRYWLAKKYSTIERLNAELSSSFKNFKQITPPSKDIKKEPLNSFFEHLDAHADGIVPFFGWAYDDSGKDFDIYVYLNGQYIGTAETGLTRLDVAQSIKGLNNSNVGYRFNLDYSDLPPGIHKVQLRFVSDGKTSILSNYNLVVMDRAQNTPEEMPAYQLTEVQADVPKTLHYWADYPTQITAVFYNPLAKLWNEFREDQVKKEIETYASLIKESCISSEKVFSHQIGAEFNSSWNPDLLASNESLLKNNNYSLGVNLYGGIVYGDYFFNWLSEHGYTRYGVPEMHPMTPQSNKTLVNALNRHHDRGAVFLSPYFMSIQPERFGSDPEHSKFQVRDNNPNYGSSEYYKAIQSVMDSSSKDRR